MDIHATTYDSTYVKVWRREGMQNNYCHNCVQLEVRIFLFILYVDYLGYIA
jgi:hypothetical protein